MTTTTHTRLPSAIETALQRVRLAARVAAEKGVNGLGLAALSATSTAQRDALLGGQFELNRKLAIFTATFNETMEDSVLREVKPRNTNSSGPTTWDMMTLVEDHEVEIKVLADRFALDIQNQCEWELRELDTYMGAAMHLKAADSRAQPAAPRDHRPRAGARHRSHHRPQGGAQGVVDRDRPHCWPAAMRQTYLDVMGDLRAAGVKPLKMTVRATEGPGSPRGLLRNRLQPGPRRQRARARAAQSRGMAPWAGPGLRRGHGRVRTQQPRQWRRRLRLQHPRPQRPDPVPDH